MENKKIKIAIIILEMVTAITFVLGSKISNQIIRTFYSRYFADIVIPFSFYFLLILVEGEHPKLKPWFVKAILVFLLCALSETLQYFGIFALARVFDPVDYVMYGVGVILAAFMDRQLFKKLFSFRE